jgi:3-oxoacyl-[acyl-carrier-protein] synthase-3
VQILQTTDAMIPEHRWFTTLPESGNVGAASIWIMLDALMRSNRVKPGERILCIVPESGRAMVGFMMLQVVGEPR